MLFVSKSYAKFCFALSDRCRPTSPIRRDICHRDLHPLTSAQYWPDSGHVSEKTAGLFVRHRLPVLGTRYDGIAPIGLKRGQIGRAQRGGFKDPAHGQILTLDRVNLNPRYFATHADKAPTPQLKGQ